MPRLLECIADCRGPLAGRFDAVLKETLSTPPARYFPAQLPPCLRVETHFADGEMLSGVLGMKPASP